MMPWRGGSCAVYCRFKSRAVNVYRGLYYGPLHCARGFRIRRCLPAMGCDNPFISERHEFIYYSIPKTGCTTVKSLMLAAENHPVPDSDEDVHLQAQRHYQAWRQAPQLDGYFKFAFVRNPWSRLVSCYCNKVVGQRDFFAAYYPYVGFMSMSFADFVRFVCRVPDDLCEPHFKPQSCFFDAGQVDFVGRFERFSDDLAQVIERIGLDQSFLKWCDTVRMKSEGGRHYTEFYDDRTRKLVAGKYQDDIEQFDYRYGE